MIKNYFKIAFRRLSKTRMYTLINLFGLTLGITSCLLIGLFIINELSYDQFNANAGRIVRMSVPPSFPIRPGDTVNVQERWF